MKKVSIQSSSKLTKLFSRLAIFAIVAAVILNGDFMCGQRLAIAQTPEVTEQVEGPIDESVLNETSDSSGNLESKTDSTGSVDSEDTILPERKFRSIHFVQIAVIAIVIIWGYSLVMSGKLGMGWMVLTAILGVFGYFGKMFKSLFHEVTSSNEVGDWEDE